MTKHESFKRRIRERMAHTGEKYGAARRALLARSAERGSDGERGWAGQPPCSDEAIDRATGRTWDAWVSLIDAEGPGRSARHTDVATWAREAQGVDGWWAQSVAIGYQRIVGDRLPGQMPDDTFTISRSRTLDLDVAALRELIEGEEQLFAGLRVTLRSRPGTKSLRLAVEDEADGTALGVIGIAVYPVGQRNRVTVTHKKLASPAEGEHWKEYWADWLTALAEAS